MQFNGQRKKCNQIPGLKSADLYTGDIVIWQPILNEPPPPVSETDISLSCSTVLELAANIQNRMTLRIVLHDQSELWAIDGIPADAGVWSQSTMAGAAVANSQSTGKISPLRDEDPNAGGDDSTAENVGGTHSTASGEVVSGKKGASNRTQEFTLDWRQGVNKCMKSIAAHFGISNPDNLYVFRNPPSSNSDDPLSPIRAKDDTNTQLKDLKYAFFIHATFPGIFVSVIQRWYAIIDM